MLAGGRIAESPSADRQVVGRLRKAEGGKEIVVANRVEPDLAERISKYGVPYTRSYEATLCVTCFS